MIHVSLVYAQAEEQFLCQLELEEGTSVQQAIETSDVLSQFPELDLKVNKIGIYAKLVKADTILHDGDRIELYRPLPKKTRDPHANDKKARIQAKKERLKASANN